MKLDKLISALTELSEKESVTEKDVANAIQANADKAYHSIFRAGFKENETRAEKDLTTVRGEVETLRSQLEKSNKLVEEFKASKGGDDDTQAIVERYEKALTTKDEELAAFRSQLEDKDKEFRASIEDREFRAFRESVKHKLVASGVNPDFAEAKVQLLDKGRIEFGEDLSVSRVLQPDGATPYPVSNEVRPFEYIAREIFESTPEALKEDRRQGGSGIGDRSGGKAPRFSEREIASMSDEDYAKHRDEIFQAQTEGRIVP